MPRVLACCLESPKKQKEGAYGGRGFVHQCYAVDVREVLLRHIRIWHMLDVALDSTAYTTALGGLKLTGRGGRRLVLEKGEGPRRKAHADSAAVPCSKRDISKPPRQI